MPDTPFLVGDLDAKAVLAELVNGPVLVDNDVNWAALAERAADPSASMDNFVYIYLGEGLGAAVVSDGEIRRGHAGMSGEIAHLMTTGARGRAMPFTEVFHELGVRHAGSTAINVDALTALIGTRGAARRKARRCHCRRGRWGPGGRGRAHGPVGHRHRWQLGSSPRGGRGCRRSIRRGFPGTCRCVPRP